MKEEIKALFKRYLSRHLTRENMQNALYDLNAIMSKESNNALIAPQLVMALQQVVMREKS